MSLFIIGKNQAPSFSKHVYKDEVEEMAKKGIKILTISASDPDPTDTCMCFYIYISMNNMLFIQDLYS